MYVHFRVLIPEIEKNCAVVHARPSQSKYQITNMIHFDSARDHIFILQLLQNFFHNFFNMNCYLFRDRICPFQESYILLFSNSAIWIAILSSDQSATEGRAACALNLAATNISQH